MASIVPGEKAKHAKRRVWFLFEGKRHAIDFPAMSYYDAIAVKQAIEDLIDARRNATDPTPKTQRWVTRQEDRQVEKLVKIGIIEPPAKKLLGDYLDQYIAERSDLKESTKRKWAATYKDLLKFFGREKAIVDVTPADAAQWRRQLGTETAEQKKLRESKGKKKAPRPNNENTRRKHTAVAKVWFNAAVKKRLIDENPFAELKATIIADPTRFHFVTREDAELAIDACPDAEWRLIVALARYGGLRCPSEVLRLRWRDVNFANQRMTVTSSKTANHIGKGTRIVPIFPELLPYLEDARELAANDAEYCITRYRCTNANLRTQFLRILKRASVQPWPKPFQNMRSTRQTELGNSFPAHVVCAWMGNSEDVARRHYLQVTDAHFDAAVAVHVATHPQTASANTS